MFLRGVGGSGALIGPGVTTAGASPVVGVPWPVGIRWV